MNKLQRYIPIAPIVYAIIVINTICFIALSQFTDKSYLIQQLALWLPINPHYAHWQWISSIFTHQNITHLFFNMYALWSFGIAVYIRLGTIKFLILYFLCALCGSILHFAWVYFQFLQQIPQLMEYGLTEIQIYQQLAQGTIYAPMQAKEVALNILQLYAQNLIGASGAIFGILVAFAYLYPNAPLTLFLIPKTFKTKYVVMIMVIYECFAYITGWSILGQHIAHLAHIGGAITGFICTSLFINASTLPNRRV